MSPGLFAETALAVVALQPFAASADVIDSLEFKHGIAFFHDLKYPTDFTHLDYLNPRAPKGGELALSTQSAFNTLAPMAERGVQPPRRPPARVRPP